MRLLRDTISNHNEAMVCKCGGRNLRFRSVPLARSIAVESSRRSNSRFRNSCYSRHCFYLSPLFDQMKSWAATRQSTITLCEEGNVATHKNTAKIQTEPPSAHQITFTAN